MSIHKRIAEELGWTLKETQSFSIYALRDLIKSPELKTEITELIHQAEHLSELVPTHPTDIY